MAATGPLVARVAGGVEIRGRRRVNTAAEFEKILDELQNVIIQIQERDENGVLTIMDCDLSQNKLPPDQFENLFALLGGATVRVQRFRLFGCPTIGDDVVKNLAEYFKILPVEAVPAELHLSDCSITTEGFHALMGAIEESEAFPLIHPHSKKKVPLYLRLENNYIDEAAIQERVDAGIIRAFKKTTGYSGPRTETDAKVDLVVRNEKQFQQKQGTPPPPEEAPPPKPVFDRWEQQQQQQQMGKGCMPMAHQWPAMMQQMWPQKGQWGPAGMMMPRATMPGAGGYTMPQPRPGGPVMPRPMMTGSVVPPRVVGGMPGKGAPAAGVRPLGSFAGTMGGKPGMQAAARPGMMAAGIQPRPFTSFAGGAANGGAAKGVFGKGAATAAARGSTAADRSRTPAPRQAQGKGQAVPPAQPPPGPKLPHPWEEHWSDEYNIPYFWNSETGDSLWERPTA